MVDQRIEIGLLHKITTSFDYENALGLFFSSRPTFLDFESLDSVLEWESYDQNKKLKVVKNSAWDFEYKWREKRWRKEGFSGQSKGAMSPTPWGVHGPHGSRGVLWPWVPRLLHGLGHVASWPPSPLARSLTFFSRILGIWTPISNLFLDFKPWLPHTWRRLYNFEKWLRKHLGKWRWSQLNEWEWERKVA